MSKVQTSHIQKHAQWQCNGINLSEINLSDEIGNINHCWDFWEWIYFYNQAQWQRKKELGNINAKENAFILENPTKIL